jgi:hypothetical protein
MGMVPTMTKRRHQMRVRQSHDAESVPRMHSAGAGDYARAYVQDDVEHCGLVQEHQHLVLRAQSTHRLWAA